MTQGELHSENQSIPSTFCIGNPIVNGYAPDAPTSDFRNFLKLRGFKSFYRPGKRPVAHYDSMNDVSGVKARVHLDFFGPIDYLWRAPLPSSRR